MKQPVSLYRPFPLRLMCAALVSATLLVACGGGETDLEALGQKPIQKSTPTGLTLEKIGVFEAGQYAVSAAEIPAFDPTSQRAFVVNALSGAVDVLDLRDPRAPTLVGQISTDAVLAGSVVNSVAVSNGLVAVAIEAPVKTDPGRMALYRARDLRLLGSVEVGAQPDMVTFTSDGKTVLTANEGEPSDDYQIDPEGSISVIDAKNPARMSVRTADFRGFNGQEALLRTQGVRIYGPRASAAQDLEPEYITVSEDGKTAWVTLQENNALARVDIKSARVSAILPLGSKDHGEPGNELDVSDNDGRTINIRTWPGVIGMYQPDAIASYKVKGRTYLVTANEGDARAWGEGNDAYWAGDASQGFVEEFRVKHLINRNGWAGRAGDDLPPQLSALAAGGLLNPEVFGYCGAVAGNPSACRDDAQLGRLNISWTMGYRTNPDGSPMMFSSVGVPDPSGNRLMYDRLFSYGGRSFSIWSEDGALVWDSGAEIERFLASDDCRLGSARNIPCADFFNSGHNEGDAKDSRSDAKGPEPEGIAIGSLGARTFAFIGLERMGGVLVYDITNPRSPFRVDYLNTRDEWLTNPGVEAVAGRLSAIGDLGPEGLLFVPAKQSPNGKPLLIVGNEVSGTTAILQLNLTF